MFQLHESPDRHKQAKEAHSAAVTPLRSQIDEGVRQLLKNTSFLGGLADDAFDAIVRRGRIKSYSSGDYLCRREERAQTLMVIMAGMVKITNCNQDGKEVVLNFLGPGETSGEMAVFDGKGRTANVIALQDTQVFLIFARDLLPLLTAHPQALLEMIQDLCGRLRDASAIIEDNSLDMRRRVARGLLRLALQHGRTSKEGIRVNLSVSQSELGAYFGLSRENVSRQLAQLRDGKVIKTTGSEIIIDQFALCEIAEATAVKTCRERCAGNQERAH
jgi:CRP/FNR family transcriptional regulator, cyclic AMP receptor protein